MSSHVISHQEPRRKRAGAMAWLTHRVVVLIVAAAGIIAASWLAPELSRPAAKSAAAPTPAPRQALEPAPPAALVTIDVAADHAPPPARRTRRAPARQSGIPLDAAATNEPAGYEILSAAELEGISQARD